MTANPVKRKAFEVPESFLDHLSTLKDKEMAGETRALCKRVKQLVVELGISDECTGFIIDGDLAVPWKESFSGENHGVKWVSCSRLPFETAPDAVTGHLRILVPEPRHCNSLGRGVPTFSSG